MAGAAGEGEKERGGGVWFKRGVIMCVCYRSEHVKRPKLFFPD